MMIHYLLSYAIWRKLSIRNKNDFPPKQNRILFKEFCLFICSTNKELKMNNFYSVFIWNQKRLEMLFIFSGTEENLFIAKPKLQQKIAVWLIVSDTCFLVAFPLPNQNRNENCSHYQILLLMPSFSSLRAVIFPVQLMWYSFQIQWIV